MAANSQEMNRAFQTAETGLARILGDDNAFNTANTRNDNGTPFYEEDDVYDYAADIVDLGDYDADASYHAVYRQKTIPKRGTGWGHHRSVLSLRFIRGRDNAIGRHRICPRRRLPGRQEIASGTGVSWS